MMSEFSWTDFTELQKIDLSHKNITELPSGISQCEGIESLNLQNNNLNNLPKDLAHLRCLKVLNLNCNSFTSLPLCIFKLQTLTELTTNNNKIASIHKDLGNLCDLNVLDVSYNQLITFTAGVGFLNRLKHINLSNNQLKRIPLELTTICGLIEIDISANQITQLPCIRNLIHLKIFNAKSNLLKKLPDFSQCRELICINFSYNVIEDIDDANLNCQPFLKEVYLQHNKLERLPDDLCNLSSLQVLDISFNNLNTLPLFMIDFPNLQQLHIAGNRFRDIPLHYTKADTARLLAFLKERASLAPVEDVSVEDDPQAPAQEPSASASASRYSLGQLRRCGCVVHNSSDEPVADAVWDNAVTAGVVIVNLSNCKLDLPLRLVELAGTLMELHLVNTGMKELPPLVGELRELQVLVLDKNDLSDLCPQLASCKYLKELSLSFNRFVEVPKVVFELKLLRTLNLSYNQLSDLNHVFGCDLTPEGKLERLQYLETLDVSNNEILHLPPQLGLMANIKTLLVTGNRFRQPSYQILSKGTEVVLAYLKNKLPEEVTEDIKEKNNSVRTPVSFFVS